MIYEVIVEFTDQVERKGVVSDKKFKNSFIVEDGVSPVDAEAQVTSYLTGTTIDWEIVKIEKKSKIEAIVKRNNVQILNAQG